MRAFRVWQVLVTENMFQEISFACMHVFFLSIEGFQHVSHRSTCSHCKVITPLKLISLISLMLYIPLLKKCHLFSKLIEVKQIWHYISAAICAEREKRTYKGSCLRVEPLSDYKKHYMSKRTTTCNLLAAEFQMQRGVHVYQCNG